MTLLSKAQQLINGKDEMWGQIIWLLIHYATLLCVYQLWVCATPWLIWVSWARPLTNSSFTWSVCSTGCWVDYLGARMVVWNNKKACSTVTLNANLCMLQSHSRRNCQHLDCVLCSGFHAEISAFVHQCRMESRRQSVGWSGKSSFIALLGKGGHNGLLPWKTMWLNPGGFDEELYSNSSSMGLLIGFVCVQGLHSSNLVSCNLDELLWLLYSGLR